MQRSFEEAEEQSDVLQVIRSEGTRSEGTEEEPLSKRSDVQNNVPDSHNIAQDVSHPEEVEGTSDAPQKEQSTKQGNLWRFPD